MRSNKDTIIITEATGIAPGAETTVITDGEGTKFCIPNRTVIRVVECLKAECELSGKDFDEWCRGIIAKRPFVLFPGNELAPGIWEAIVPAHFIANNSSVAICQHEKRSESGDLCTVCGALFSAGKWK